MKRLVLVLLAVAMLAGNASATGANILDQYGNNLPYIVKIAPGSTTVYGHSLAGLPESGTITYVITSSSPDLQVNQLKTTTTLNGNDPLVDLNVFELILSPTATTGSKYKITVSTYIDGEEYSSEDLLASATQRFEAIPEFPTVALPVAAILGLAFFMQRRKEE